LSLTMVEYQAGGASSLAGFSFSLRSLCVLCASAVNLGDERLTAETQRTRRMRREDQTGRATNRPAAVDSP
jgi:hypothetical protein